MRRRLHRDYVSAEDEDVPGYTVFTRRDGKIRHFWSAEISGEMADPGQDPRGAPDPDPLWTLLAHHARGTRSDWYPKLEYSSGGVIAPFRGRRLPSIEDPCRRRPLRARQSTHFAAEPNADFLSAA